MSAKSMLVDGSPSSKPTTLLLRTNPPYFYNTWTLNNRLRLKNERLSKRQQSSCCIAFYSLCICVSAGIVNIVIYRFTDECSSPDDDKQFLIECFRHWLFLAATSISLLACIAFLFGACRYFRSQRVNCLYEDACLSPLGNTNGLLPITTTAHYYGSPTLLANGTSIVSSRYRDDEHSNITIRSSLANISPRRKMPPFNYDELPDAMTPNIVSISPNIDTHHRTTFSRSSPQPISFSSARTSDTTNATINSNKNKATFFFDDIYPRTLASHPTLDRWTQQ